MDADELVSLHPRLFHMAEAGSWPSIRRNGLRSTSALLDLFEVSGSERARMETARRQAIVEIHHPVHGTAQIRDTNPIREHLLVDRLEGITLPDWYRLLNSKVFFWVDEERLTSLRTARAYRSRSHDILTLDTAAVLARYEHAAALTTINSGATLFPSAPPRGRYTFVPLADFEPDGRRSGIVELTIDGAVTDLDRVVVRVDRHEPDMAPVRLWQRPAENPTTCEAA